MSNLYRSSQREASRSAPPPHRPLRRTSFLDRLVVGLSLLNLLAVIGLLILLCVVSEQWWLSLGLSYLPRVPYVLPSLLLLGASLLLRRRIVWINLFAAILVLGPIMGFRMPLAAWLTSGSSAPLTIVSYNVQGGGASPETVLAELVNAEPDLFVLQEATLDAGPLRDHFDDWHFVHSGEYLVAARWPVTMKDACRSTAFGRATGILCEVAHPSGAFLVGDIHLTTARHGLSQLRPDSPLSGQGVEALQARQALRDQEAFDTRSCLADVGFDTPMLVVGDFNMPVSSSLFQKYWSGLTSAFDAAGWGYGYTSPCNTQTLWPTNTPWLRIDHILLSPHWSAESCWVGRTNGSDHRLIAARVMLR